MGLKRGARTRLLRSGFPVPEWLVKPKDRMLYAEAMKLARQAVVVDLGANVGHTAEVFADRGATVHAYEPNPDAFALLRERLGGRGNVFLHRQAVGGEDGTAKLFLHRNYSTTDHSQSSSIIADKDNVNPDTYTEVQVVDVAGIISALGRVHLMKVDVEGAEYAILRRLIETGLMDRIDRIVVETHESRAPSLRPAHEETVARLDQANLWDKVSLDWR